MKRSAQFLVAIAIFGLSGWLGSTMFTYFTYQHPPVIALHGIDNNGFYSRTIQGKISSTNDYKINEVITKLDGETLFSTNVKAAQFSLPFSIDTQALPNGQHILEIYAIDSSYHQNKTHQKYTLNIDNTPLRAAFLDAENSTFQGKTLHMKIQANKKLAQAEVKFLSSVYTFYPESEDSTLYECFIPIDCEERPNNYIVTAKIEDSVKNYLTITSKVNVKKFPFKKQHGFTIAEDKLSHEKEIGMSTKILDEALDKWLKESPQTKLWKGSFELPITVQRVSTPFGEIRMTPERGRYLHRGIDLTNRPRSVVCASQHGNVIIKDRFFLTGNTVVLDHGLGVFTLYAHLEEFSEIEIGDMIKKGKPLGKLGKTGYATGYHLHWELRVNNVSVDPMEWTNKIF